MNLLALEYRSIGLYLAIILGTLAAIVLSPPPTLVELAEPLPRTLTIEAGSFYSNNFNIHRAAPKLKIDIETSGKAYLKVGDTIQPCSNDRCKLVFNLTGGLREVPLEIYSDDGATVRHFGYSVVKYKNDTTLSQVSLLQWQLLGLAFLVVFIVNFRFYSAAQLNQWLLVSLSLVFLAVNDWLFLLALLFFLWLCFITRHQLSKSRKTGWLWGAILTAAGFLLFWKYGKESIYTQFADIWQLSYFMPIGISYFVIRLIDTILRWYRKELLEISFREFLLFIVFPGTLLAGPIENLKDFYAHRCQRLEWNDIGYGLSRTLIGLAKKLVLADGLLFAAIHGAGDFGSGIDHLITHPQAVAGWDVMAFALAGLLYAYIDFSAYSDMAIGISRMFGYRICENFNFPLLAQNIREYWKRWHMSLSNWAFRNVYFPTLVQTRNSYLPLFLTMLVIGLWHAFSLSWFAWAIHHATGMSAVALFQQRYTGFTRNKNPILHILCVTATLIYASMGFVFVYLDDFSIALQFYVSYWKLFFPSF